MISIKVKSGSAEIEIETDQAQTPKQMADAIIDFIKASRAAKTAQSLDTKEISRRCQKLIHQ